MFVKGLEAHSKQWKLIAELIKTRTVVQVRTHAQKYFQKLLKQAKNDGTNITEEAFADMFNESSADVSLRSHSITPVFPLDVLKFEFFNIIGAHTTFLFYYQHYTVNKNRFQADLSERIATRFQLRAK